MSDKTGIEWTDATWNPVTGCSKVSAGCKHCYAEREWPRMTKLVPAYAGRDFTDVRTHEDRLTQPMRWTKPRMIFVNSMSDLFHPDVPFDFIDLVFSAMELSPRHVFQVLTKRPERMRDYIKSRAFKDYPLPNVWLGVSVEDQAAADERIPLLLDTPAAVRWISAEPLLGPIVLPECTGDWRCKLNGIDGHSERPLGGLGWVVVGGESGPKARPMHLNWARILRDQCAAAGVPFLFKQWGEWAPGENCGGPMTKTEQTADWFAEKWSFGSMTPSQSEECHIDDEPLLYRCGKKRAGRLLDGVTHDGYPETKQ